MIDEKVRERLLTLGRELVFLLEERLPQDYDWEIEVEDTLEKLMDWKPEVGRRCGRRWRWQWPMGWCWRTTGRYVNGVWTRDGAD
jgi:hypothetical protein